MKLPRSFIDELLSRVDIIDIVEPRIHLKKAGANYSALCPFHQEKSPSFSVSQTKQFYYCFGCKASGNAIGFLMSYDQLTFMEAIDYLAGKAGMIIPDTDTKESPQPSLDLMEQAAKYFELQLSKTKQAQKYLVDRGLSAEIIKQFQIGFAADAWHDLLNALGKSPQATQQLAAVGLIVSKGSKTFDRFRDRIMFPIHNKRGQVIAFGGRSLHDQQPKYLNSPETELFHKAHELYGLNHVLKANRQTSAIVVVEGYLDVIALHQHGVTNAVATLGTAISSHHIHTLLRYCQDLVFCFDGDLAGHKAAWRALEICMPLMNEGIQVRFLFLPKGEDPDTYIRKEGRATFIEKANQAIPLVDFFFGKLKKQTEIETIAGKTRFVHFADKFLHKIPKGIFQELIYERLATTIGLSLQKIQEILRPGPTSSQPKKPAIARRSMPQPIKTAISLLLQCPSLLEKLELPATFESVDLQGMELLKQVIQAIRLNPKQRTGSLLDYLKEHQDLPLLSHLAAQDLLIPEQVWQNELQGAINCIRDINKEARIQQLLSKGNSQGLTLEEKQLLQQLLMSKA